MRYTFTVELGIPRRIVSIGDQIRRFFIKPEPERKMRYQIYVFLKWRRKNNLGGDDYEDVLNLFLKWTPKDDILDVTPEDVTSFIDSHVHVHRGSQFEMKRYELVLRQIVRWFSARGNMFKGIADYKRILELEGVNFMVDINRNKKIFKLWIEDQELPPRKRRWSLRKIGKHFGISHVRVDQIIKQELAKRSRLGVSFT